MLYLFFYIILAFCSLIRKKSKIVCVLLVGLLFIMTIFSQSGNDINNIREMFDYTIFTKDALERSPFFCAIVLFFSELGISFTQFRILQFLIWALAFFFFLKRFSLYPTLVVTCCFFFPIVGFGAQFRNGIMVGLLYFALYFLLFLERKKGILVYMILLGIASLIHTIALIYLSLLLAFVPCSRLKLTKICVICCVAMTIIVNTSILFGFVLNNFGDWNSQYFSSMESMNLTIFILLVGIVANLKLSCRYSDVIASNKRNYNKFQLELAELTPRINLVMMALIPLLFFSLSFYRIFQNLFILSSVLAINTYRINRTCRDGDMVIYLVVYAMITIFYNRWQGEFLPYLNGIHI